MVRIVMFLWYLFCLSFVSVCSETGNTEIISNKKFNLKDDVLKYNQTEKEEYLVISHKLHKWILTPFEQGRCNFVNHSILSYGLKKYIDSSAFHKSI